MYRLRFLAPFVVMLSSCQELKSGSIDIPEYPDIEETYHMQIKKLGNQKLIKAVSLDDKKEQDTIPMDTLRWKKELSFLVEVNPNKPEYVGVFKVRNEADETELILKEGENGVLKYLRILKSSNGYKSLEAAIHEDKDVYSQHREINVTFSDDLIATYEINGYQKMMFKDTVWFGIKGRIIE